MNLASNRISFSITRSIYKNIHLCLKIIFKTCFSISKSFFNAFDDNLISIILKFDNYVLDFCFSQIMTYFKTDEQKPKFHLIVCQLKRLQLNIIHILYTKQFLQQINAQEQSQTN